MEVSNINSQARRMVQVCKGHSQITFDQCHELLQFIFKTQHSLEWSEGKNHHLARPHETNLARSVIFFPDGSSVIPFNRSKCGDDPIGFGTCSSIKMGFHVTLLKVVVLSSTLDDPIVFPLVKEGISCALNLASCPNVVSFHHAFEKTRKRDQRKKHVAVMDYIPGKTATYFPFKKYPLEQRMKWVIELLSGIKSFHDRGVIHSDLHDGNVMITRDERLVIIDFGLAHSSTPDGQGKNRGFKLNRVSHIPPQWWNTSKRLHQKNDLWAAGIMLWQILYADIAPYVSCSGCETFYDEVEWDLDLASEITSSPLWLMKEDFQDRAVLEKEESIGARLALFVADLLHPNLRERPTAGEALEKLHGIM